jgi:DNA repair protein RadC
MRLRPKPDTALPAAEEAAAPPGHVNHRQRLRQRFLAGDAGAIPDYELLELLLFYSIDRVDVKPLAKQLLKDFRSVGGVLAAEPAQLLAYDRVNDRTLALFKALREVGRRLIRAELAERPVISSWDRLIDYCRLTMAHEAVERFRVLYLNRKNMLIADEVQQKGTVDHTPVYPREVVKRALELGATSLIVVHNHPSGDPTPSSADIEMTRALRDAAQALGIGLHDHVVIGKQGSNSLRALGLL